jgi:hypothetical protein
VLTEELLNTFALKKWFSTRVLPVLLNEGFFLNLFYARVAGLRFLFFFVNDLSRQKDYLIFELLYHYHLEGYPASSVQFMKS